MSYREQLDMQRIPRHVAIIMDGNGRWAKQRGLERIQGHQEGVEALRRVTEECVALGVKHLTAYTFSTENWNRPAPEVAALMKLMLASIDEEIFMKNNVRLRMIGQLSRLPKEVLDGVNELVEHSANNTAMTVNLAVSYSSRWEMADAVQRIAHEVERGTLKPDDVTEDTLAQHLMSSYSPDPDLLIRTGGEFRLSNFLLWQSAYTELYFCDTYWPDFGREDLCKAILDYQQRERRFGKTSEQIQIIP